MNKIAMHVVVLAASLAVSGLAYAAGETSTGSTPEQAVKSGQETKVAPAKEGKDGQHAAKDAKVEHEAGKPKAEVTPKSEVKAGAPATAEANKGAVDAKGKMEPESGKPKAEVTAKSDAKSGAPATTEANKGAEVKK